MGIQVSSYVFSILILVSITGVTALALNLQWGLADMVNFGLYGFYMLAAYICAMLTHIGWNPWLATAAAVLGTGIVSAAVSLISIRLAEDYLAIVTLGFAECLRLVFTHEDWLTRGSLGISDIQRPVDGDFSFLALTLLSLALVFIVMQVIARSPFGRVARALRDDPLVGSTLGKNVLAFRVAAIRFGRLRDRHRRLSARLIINMSIDPVWPIITAYAFMAVMICGGGSNTGCC